jgi:hypothetical protein
MFQELNNQNPNTFPLTGFVNQAADKTSEDTAGRQMCSKLWPPKSFISPRKWKLLEVKIVP